MEDGYIPRTTTYEDYKSIDATLLLKKNANLQELVQKIKDFSIEYYTNVPDNCYSPILPLKPTLNGNSEIYLRIKYNPAIEENYIKNIILKKLRKKFKKKVIFIKHW